MSVAYGSSAGTAVEGNDPRLVEDPTRPLLVDASADPKAHVPLLSVRNTTATPAWNAQPLLTVDASGSVLARGALGIGVLPPVDKGPQLLWYPTRGAFRAGDTSTPWTDTDLGDYSWAGGNNTLANAYGAFAFGDQCAASATVAACFGSANQASGTASFVTGASSVASGFGSVAMGYTNKAAGQGAVALGYRVTADADYATALGHRVGSGGHSGAFIWGDQSTTTPSTNTANNQFMVRAAGGLRLRTNATLTTGCDLPAGSGVFSCTSDRDSKADFRRVDGEEILAKVARMPVDSWRYRGEDPAVRHVGPVAQDFRAAFGLGVDDKSIGLLDIDGVNLAAIKALERRTRELDARTAEVEALKAELGELKRHLVRLEAAMSPRAVPGPSRAP